MNTLGKFDDMVPPLEGVGCSGLMRFQVAGQTFVLVALM
jgi:hypothetical protein